MTGFILSPGIYITLLGFILPHVFRTVSIVLQKEAIMADIDVLDFGRTSSDGAAGESFLATRRMLEILQVCFEIISVFENAVNLADKNLQMPAIPNYRDYSPHHDETEIRAKFKILFDGYREMFD